HYPQDGALTVAQHALVWLRDDLRLSDNPALHAALQCGRATAVFITETGAGHRPEGGAARWWRGESLGRFRRDLDGLGVPLRIETGDAEILLPQIAGENGADSVGWNRRYHPAGRRTDAAITARFAAQDFPATS